MPHKQGLIATVVALCAWSATARAHVFLRPAQAAGWMRAEKPTVLDARGHDAKPPFLPGAVPIDWRDHRTGGLRSGLLGPDARTIAAALSAAGVSTDRPVLVYGAGARGWGQEARVWWMLRYLGHPEVRILDGGLKGWRRQGRPTVGELETHRGGARFEPREAPALRATTRAVRDAIASGSTRLLDVRTTKEYAGATPFWSQRGGHIPGARHLYWRALLDEEGFLRGSDELEALFDAAGIRRDVPVITYCTGGVRSAFVQAALLNLGYTQVANYDGSWWAWSARGELPIRKIGAP